MVVINGVTNKIKTSHTKTTFVDGVIKQWIVLSDVGDTDDGIVRLHGAYFTEGEGEVTRNNDGFFAVRKVVIEVATKIIILVVSCRTHILSCLLFVLEKLKYIIARKVSLERELCF